MVPLSGDGLGRRAGDALGEVLGDRLGRRAGEEFGRRAGEVLGPREPGPGRGRSVLAALLVAGFAGCLALSLWHRVEAVLLFAVLGLLPAPVVLREAARRAVVAVLVPPVMAALAVALPVLGDAIDAASGVLLVVAIGTGRLNHLLRKAPYALACAGCYAGLWLAVRCVPWGAVSGGTRPVWFDAAVAAGALLAGAVYFALVAGAARLARQDRATAVLYTVGFPVYLVVSVLTFFLGDRHGKV